MKFSRARMWRRLLAMMLDLIVPMIVSAVVGLAVARSSFSPPAGWFWSEWLLKIWLDHPTQILVPAGTFLGAWLVQNFLWEGFRSRTFGAGVLGLQVVTSRGRPIGWKHAVLRLVGGLLDILTLGFGAAWAAIDPEGRALHDRLSGTWVIARHEG